MQVFGENYHQLFVQVVLFRKRSHIISAAVVKYFSTVHAYV